MTQEVGGDKWITSSWLHVPESTLRDRWLLQMVEGGAVQGMHKIQLLIEGGVGDLLGDNYSNISSAQLTPFIMPVLWAEWKYMQVFHEHTLTKLVKEKNQGEPVDFSWVLGCPQRYFFPVLILVQKFVFVLCGCTNWKHMIYLTGPGNYT